MSAGSVILLTAVLCSRLLASMAAERLEAICSELRRDVPDSDACGDCLPYFSAPAEQSGVELPAKPPFLPVPLPPDGAPRCSYSFPVAAPLELASGT